MNDEFKKISKGNVTRYVLENASGGGTSSGSVASVSMPMGGTRKRGDNLITQEADKKTIPTSTPRNFVAKNAKASGAGAHKDKKKAAKQGQEKHKKPFMEGFNGEYDDEAGMAKTDLHTIARAAQGLLDTIDDKENLPEWAQEKLAKVEGMLVGVWDYLKSQEEQGIDPRVDQGVAEVKQRLDPKCWTGKHKEGTKIKGGVRVNNCVPNEGVAEGVVDTIKKVGKALVKPVEVPGLNQMKDIHNTVHKREIAAQNKKYAPKDVEEAGDTAKGQKMLAKVHQRAADRVTSKQADKDPAYARKAQQTQDRAWDRLAVKEQGVAEGVAETLPMDDAVKVLRQYGADHFKTTSNELHFYKNGQHMSVDLIFNSDATRSVSLSQLNSVARQLKGQGVAEGAKVDRQAKHITASMMKKGKSKKDAESIAWAHIKHPKTESTDPYFESLQSMVERQLEPTMDLDAWNDNFQNADPQKYHQFKNKTPEKKK